MQKTPPTVWEALAQATKHQKLIVLQMAFNMAAEDMRLCVPTIATPSLLKLILTLGFRMESRDDLTTGSTPSSSASTHPWSGSSCAARGIGMPWTCFGMDHNASKGLKEFGEEMSARVTKL